MATEVQEMAHEIEEKRVIDRAAHVEEEGEQEASRAKEPRGSDTAAANPEENKTIKDDFSGDSVVTEEDVQGQRKNEAGSAGEEIQLGEEAGASTVNAGEVFFKVWSVEDHGPVVVTGGSSETPEANEVVVAPPPTDGSFTVEVKELKLEKTTDTESQPFGGQGEETAEKKPEKHGLVVFDPHRIIEESKVDSAENFKESFEKVDEKASSEMTEELSKEMKAEEADEYEKSTEEKDGGTVKKDERSPNLAELFKQEGFPQVQQAGASGRLHRSLTVKVKHLVGKMKKAIPVGKSPTSRTFSGKCGI